jgi:hypothetical protein
MVFWAVPPGDRYDVSEEYAASSFMVKEYKQSTKRQKQVANMRLPLLGSCFFRNVGLSGLHGVTAQKAVTLHSLPGGNFKPKHKYISSICGYLGSTFMQVGSTKVLPQVPFTLNSLPA